MYVRHTFTFGERTVTLETGEVARQASGAAVLDMDGTIVLATVVAAKEPRSGASFFPLTV